MNFKKILGICFSVLLSTTLFAQANNNVDLGDEVYDVLNAAYTKGYCNPLSNYKPYTEKYVISVLDEIYENLSELDENYAVRVEKEIIQRQKERMIHEVKGFDPYLLEYSHQGNYDNFKPTLFMKNFITTEGYGGLYNNSEFNSYGLDAYDRIWFYGQLTDFLSYRMDGYVGFSRMPLYKLGSDYFVGNWWKETDFYEDKTKNTRTVNAYKNFSVLNYNYKKPWNGSVYYLTHFNADGLEGWPQELALGFGMEGEITASFFDNKLIVRAGRYSHELAAMDTNSSLVLNGSAQPFMGIDVHFKLNEFFSLDSVTGWLEFPNQSYITENSLYQYDVDTDGNIIKNNRYGANDGLFFQNMYTAKSANFDFKYFHFDIGSTCVYPKRFEIGYLFPIMDCAIYQNYTGDYDNLGLFADAKGIWPGVGQIWISGFLDEMNKPNAKWWENTRCMLALQGGIKANIPWLPNGHVSFRYTKVEPYCYTHQLLVNNPYSPTYVAESYTNNGSSLGYYLQPNSDEFLLDFNFNANRVSKVGFTYQLTRHGADWGSGQVEGSNIYSELRYRDRDELKKYFLYDGTYEWTSSINLYGSYTINQLPFSLKLDCSVAYVVGWFTGVEVNGQKNATYSVISTDEYKPYSGVVASLGVTIFGK